MDGFYVAKTQKLSDKQKGEENKKAKKYHKVKDDAMKAETGNDKKDEQHQSLKKESKKPKGNNKRGKGASQDDTEGDGNSSKKTNMSIDPNVQV